MRPRPILQSKKPQTLRMVCSTLSQEPTTTSLANLPEMKKLPPQIWTVELEVTFKRQSLYAHHFPVGGSLSMSKEAGEGEKQVEGDNGDVNELPELKGKVSVDMLMKIFQKILLKPQGKVSIFASALTVVVIPTQHEMSFVITISLSCWNSKMVINQADPQNLSACATLGIASVICIDATGGLLCNGLEVNHFYIGGKDLNDDTDSEIDPAVTKALEEVMQSISASHLAPAISAIPTNDSLISRANSR
ncbi:hypothetical protein Ddye_015824 [Dipteronia dyeriana]|uniref:Uncharacterized protein n=1 Tax=Dipteronia dyeriana TaxID=168575 RepID=A0AAD9U5J1_9ROSI|nr:hypothetical protein Ddye_015824 [Dipteronia dyeriana]